MPPVPTSELNPLSDIWMEGRTSAMVGYLHFAGLIQVCLTPCCVIRSLLSMVVFRCGLLRFCQDRGCLTEILASSVTWVEESFSQYGSISRDQGVGGYTL